MSDTTREPCVVIIDDQLDNVQNLASDLRKGNLEVETTEPHQLGEVALREGTIFLVDMFLTEWPGRNKLRPSAQVFDGIALAAVIRAHARHADRPIPIVALNTGRADDLSELPLEIREHAIARAHNLEWVFLKNDSPSPVPTHERIAELADAQRRLPVTWTADTGEAELLSVLAATEDELTEILDAWPPIREVGKDTGGIAVLRWLLHRILPYPCFLLDERHVAVRLGMTRPSLTKITQGTNKLALALEGCRYKGILSGFEGPRWWRSRLEAMLWQFSPNGTLPATTDDLESYSDTGFERAATPNGVIVLSADYTPREEPVDITKAVRIRLDDWPPYAESAWAAISDALEDPRLRDRVLPLDRPRLEE